MHVTTVAYLWKSPIWSGEIYPVQRLRNVAGAEEFRLVPYSKGCSSLFNGVHRPIQQALYNAASKSLRPADIIQCYIKVAPSERLPADIIQCCVDIAPSERRPAGIIQYCVDIAPSERRPAGIIQRYIEVAPSSGHYTMLRSVRFDRF